MRQEHDRRPPTVRDLAAGWCLLIARALARGYLVIALALAACAIVPMVAGLTGSVVQSGSMMPHVRVGDVALSRPLADSAPLPLGRVITFEAPAGSAESGIRLHRLVEVRPDGSLITKGDANRDADSAPIRRADIIATAGILVPWIGLPAYWAQHGLIAPLALWIGVSLLALLIEYLASRSEASARRALRPPRERAQSHVDPAPARAPVVGTAITLGSLVLCCALVVAAPIAPQVSAAFTASSVSGDNSWTAALVVAPTKLAVTVSPSSSTGGTRFSTQPVVAIQGALGQATTSTAPVTLAITTPGGAVLTCASNPLAAASGTARFSGCAIDLVGTYTVTATSPGLASATSATFAVSVGVPSRLAFTVSPKNTARSTVFAVQPVVAVLDAGGNTVSASTVPVTLTAAGASLTCTANPKNAVTGVASFSGCRMDQTGGFSLTATSGSLQSATSSGFSIFSTPSRLVFLASPSSSASSVAFATQPSVAIQDASGNTTSATTPLTLSITTPAGATLTCGANPRVPTDGVATFSGCAIGKAGTYTLTASAGTLTAATTASFTITPGQPSRLAFTTSPSGTASASAFATQPVVVVLDAFGNTTASTAAVALAVSTPAGTVMTCTSNPKSAVSGVAAFAGCRIGRAGTYTLTATSAGLTSAVSAGFTIVPGAAAKLAFTTSPGDSDSRRDFAAQPVVAVQDAFGNTVSSSALVTIAITAPAGGANLTCLLNPWFATGGVVTYSGCDIDRPGTYTLTASALSLASEVSLSFVVR